MKKDIATPPLREEGHQETPVSLLAETGPSGAVCVHCRQVHPSGQFVAGCPGPRLLTGERSALVRSGAAIGQEDIYADRRLKLRAELGASGVIKTELADAFVELTAIRAYLGGRLEAEGPLTIRGRKKALLTAYLGIVDRQVRLAQALGVEPLARQLTPLEAWAELKEAKAQREGDR